MRDGESGRGKRIGGVDSGQGSQGYSICIGIGWGRDRGPMKDEWWGVGGRRWFDCLLDPSSRAGRCAGALTCEGWRRAAICGCEGAKGRVAGAAEGCREGFDHVQRIGTGARRGGCAAHVEGTGGEDVGETGVGAMPSSPGRAGTGRGGLPCRRRVAVCLCGCRAAERRWGGGDRPHDGIGGGMARSMSREAWRDAADMPVAPAGVRGCPSR